MVIVAKWPDISIITGIQVNLRASASIGVCVCVRQSGQEKIWEKMFAMDLPCCSLILVMKISLDDVMDLDLDSMTMTDKFGPARNTLTRGQTMMMIQCWDSSKKNKRSTSMSGSSKDLTECEILVVSTLNIDVGHDIHSFIQLVVLSRTRLPVWLAESG